MSISIPDFWKLARDSRLLSGDQCQTLRSEYSQVRGADQQGNAKTLAEWLVSRNVLSRYQATVLKAGRAGPFLYGDYTVYDRISGPGPLEGMFRAVHTATGHPTMLRFLTAEQTEDEYQWAVIATHVQRHCRVQHPQLLACHELADLSSFRFLVFEELQGRSLEARLVADGPLAAGDACRFVRQAARAAAHLHQQHLVHADLRPFHLWEDTAGQCKLIRNPLLPPGPLSFSDPEQAAALTARADYLAPELMQPGKQPDASSDIYALGCTLYQLLANRPPFAGGDLTNKLQRHAKDPIHPLESQGVDPQLAQVVTYMMAKNPALRIPSMEVVADKLAAFVSSEQREPAPITVAPTTAAFERSVAEKQAALQSKQTQAAKAAPLLELAAAADQEGQGSTAGSTSDRVRRSTGKNGNRQLLVIGGVAVAALLLIGVVFGVQAALGPGTPVAQGPDEPGAPDGPGPSGPNSPDGPPAGDPNGFPEVPPVDPTTSEPAEPPSGPTMQIVPDDGQLLWAPPTSGSALDLRFLPSGGQVFGVVRPADLLAAPGGANVLQALGPAFQQARADWETAAGVTWEQVELLVVGLFDNGDQLPRPCYVVRLRDPQAAATLVESWGNPEPIKQGSMQYYNVRGWSFLVPGDESQTSFVMGSEQEIKQVIEAHGARPVLRRGMGSLLEATDEQRHLTILFAPNYLYSNLFRDGRKYYFGEPRRLREGIRWFIEDEVQAVSLSMHFGDAFYFESRLYASLSKDKHTLAQGVRERIQQIPDLVEEELVTLNPHPYWKRVAFRYPGMVRFLHDQMRTGVEDSHAVLNAALPGEAAANLLFGGEMLLANVQGSGGVAAVPVPTGPKTMDELLEQLYDLSFGQSSLEFAMRDLAQDVRETFPELPFDFQIAIIGDDLMLNGITRNQQIRDFNQKQKPLSEVLTALVMKANPVPNIEKPSELDQKLIWVIGPDPKNPDKKIVLITTRDAATAKKYTLPAPFQPE